MTLPPTVHDTRPPLARRGADLERLADEHWDLLVVGGGIVGAGAFLDAASRGLRVALVEQDDIASGTSSRSSRLIHGGLRYLQQLEVPLVREALAERARLLRLAPHLVRLEAFLFPLYGPPAITRAFYEAGITLYDLLGSRRSGGWHRHLGLEDTLDYAPDLVTRDLRGALLYHDAMEDDARFALAVVRTAQARFGQHAVAVTRVRAKAPIRHGSRGSDPIGGAIVEDRLTGATFDDPGVGRARCDRRLGRVARPAVRRGLVRGRAGARRAPRHPARPDPGPRRHDAPDPRPRRVPRALAAALDRGHDGHAAHGARGPDRRHRRGRRRDPRHAQRRARARPDARRPRGHVRGAAAADRAVGDVVDGQGLARAPGERRGARASSG